MVPRCERTDWANWKRTGRKADSQLEAYEARLLIAESGCGRLGRFFALGVCYAATMVVGFSAMGNLSKPLEDPYLAIAEILILVTAPILVLLAVVIHTCAPTGTETYGLTAVGCMLLMAGFTMTVHLVLLTVVRRIDPNAIQGFQYLFAWQWPSMLYGVELVAWDIFFGLGLLFAAAVFHASGHVAVRNGMLIAGALSVLGIIGPAVDHFALSWSSESESPLTTRCAR